jgi:hypothetical protein
MSLLGDVVFCVDCDRARLSPPQSEGAGPPRRMAVKKDANADPLCASCLDARQAKRRAAFMLHEGRAPLPSPQPPVDATAPSAPRKKVEFVRIVRSRPQQPDVSSATRKKSRAHKGRSQRATPTTKGRAANGRAVERQFVMLAAEMGFLRAQRLLDGLKTARRTAPR